MRHVVILYMDEESEAVVSGLQRSLDAVGVATPLRCGPEQRPHITMASYLAVPNVADLVDLVRRYAWARAPLGIRFESLSVFPRTGVLFLAPAPSLGLLRDHEDLYDQVDRLELPADAHYAPDSWTPHCTLAEGLAKEQLGPSMDQVLRELKFPFVARARSVGVIKVDGEPPTVKSLAEFAWGK